MLNKSVGSAFGELPFCWEEMWYIWGGRKQPTTATREQYLETVEIKRDHHRHYRIAVECSTTTEKSLIK